MAGAPSWHVSFPPLSSSVQFHIRLYSPLEATYSERSGLNADMADRFSASFPHFTSNGLVQRMIQEIAAADK